MFLTGLAVLERRAVTARSSVFTKTLQRVDPSRLSPVRNQLRVVTDRLEEPPARGRRSKRRAQPAAIRGGGAVAWHPGDDAPSLDEPSAPPFWLS
jgi:hypothetical protein